jgi:hypothetical protein
MKGEGVNKPNRTELEHEAYVLVLFIMKTIAGINKLIDLTEDEDCIATDAVVDDLKAIEGEIDRFRLRFLVVDPKIDFSELGDE